MLASELGSEGESEGARGGSERERQHLIFQDGRSSASPWRASIEFRPRPRIVIGMNGVLPEGREQIRGGRDGGRGRVAERQGEREEGMKGRREGRKKGGRLGGMQGWEGVRE